MMMMIPPGMAMEVEIPSSNSAFSKPEQPQSSNDCQPLEQRQSSEPKEINTTKGEPERPVRQPKSKRRAKYVDAGIPIGKEPPRV